ncbi:MAG TPA: thioesterase family protein [Solirubrobacterales bacterium]|nr:thioesterase family protein [Solirubrobacterales bacterium]
MAVEGYPFSVGQEVVLHDLDAFGHVNNAVYLTYIENARVAYFREALGVRTIEEIRNIMAAVTIEFRAEISYGDALEIGVRTERVGNKSFVLRYLLTLGDGTVAAEATSTQVMFDYEQRTSIPIPDDWRQKLSRSS